MSMWKFVTKKRTPDDIVLRLPDPAKATSFTQEIVIKTINKHVHASPLPRCH